MYSVLKFSINKSQIEDQRMVIENILSSKAYGIAKYRSSEVRVMGWKNLPE